jgi:hypothetical protein
MKRCPNCEHAFDDDYDFCLDDGTPLVLDSVQRGFGGFKSPGEMTTQFIPHPQISQYQTPQVIAAHSSKWVFPLVGILCGLVVIFGFFAFFKESSSDKPAVAQKNTEVGESNKNTETRRSPQVESTPVPPYPSQLPPSANQVMILKRPSAIGERRSDLAEMPFFESSTIMTALSSPPVRGLFISQRISFDLNRTITFTHLKRLIKTSKR